MTATEDIGTFTINAAAATGKFRVKPHLGQCQVADRTLVISTGCLRCRLSYGLGYQWASVDKRVFILC